MINFITLFAFVYHTVSLMGRWQYRPLFPKMWSFRLFVITWDGFQTNQFTHSWLIDAGRIDVYSCLRLPFPAAGNWFWARTGSLSSQYTLGFGFVIFSSIKPRLESFQLKQSVSQPHILPLSLKVTRHMHGIRENSPLLLEEESRVWLRWEYHPHASRGSTLLCKGLWARIQIPGLSLTLSWQRPHPHETLCSLP